MAEFLRLPAKDQIDILQYAEIQLNRSAQVLRKDIWVVWALQHLFSIKTNVKMAFKGGTSLSKVYGVIDRFSEDVDITLDYRDLDPSVDPFKEGLSRTELKAKITPRLKTKAKEHVEQVVVPSLKESFEEVTEGVGKISIAKDGEEVFLYFPASPKNRSGYLEDWIKLEFGGRNSINPRSAIRVDSDIAKVAFQVPLEFPSAEVEVFSAERTFWEKATLIHAECHRPENRFNPGRKSRHWHDLYKLLGHEIGKKALENRELLKDVIKFKEVFFYTGYANYDACLKGDFSLIPPAKILDLLHGDYDTMVESGMFESVSPSFDEIAEILRGAEEKINQGNPA